MCPNLKRFSAYGLATTMVHTQQFNIDEYFCQFLSIFSHGLGATLSTYPVNSYS